MPLPEYQYFARRLLNPFQGTAQIVETSMARAITTDGQNWRLQICSNIYKLPWSSLAMPAESQHYFAYGQWSRNEGLARLPIHPGLYQEHVEQAVADLLTLLAQLQAAIPFPLQDTFELWLFDNNREYPIALLASCQTREEIDTGKRLEWYPAARADSTFTSAAFSVEQQRAAHGISAQDLLRNLVRKRCNRHCNAYWIRRLTDAGGVIVHDHRGHAERRDEIVCAERFPEYLLTDDWHDPQASQLVTDYFAWQAPLLLMLPLPDSKRRKLEQHAVQQPLRVHRYHRLYPKICDTRLLNKTLVEAVLREAQTATNRGMM